MWRCAQLCAPVLYQFAFTNRDLFSDCGSQPPDDLNSGFAFTNRELELSDPGSQPPSYLNPGVVIANRELKVSDRGSQTECPAT